MKPYTPKTFTIPQQLSGMSQESIQEHLKLYSGYVTHTNLISEKQSQLVVNSQENSYVLGELQRRFSFEFNGMRNHELYFSQLEHGPSPLGEDSVFKKAIESTYSSFDTWLSQFKLLALTRGIGWAMLYWDTQTNQLTHGWVDEQHLGHLVGLTPILALDMWEHSFVADYQPSGKKQYVEDFFANMNWEIIEQRFIAAQK